MLKVVVVAVIVAAPARRLATPVPSVRWLLSHLVGLALPVMGIPTG